MIDTIYVEREIATHERTQQIVSRYPRARIVECNHYKNIFDRRAQNFRAQKSRPALILASKHGRRLHEVPDNQNLGAPRNYYFSHLLNCPFDCRYCFLQGMFASANYVLFVNYDDFISDIREITGSGSDTVHFFSGYDCDSLALEPMTRFAEFFVPQFRDVHNGVLELRTKSTQIRSLLNLVPHSHCVVAMSLTPQMAAERYDHGAPSLNDRLEALRRLQGHGWPIGLRFDPILPLPDNRNAYTQFFDTVFDVLEPSKIHSATLGDYRMPKAFAKRMQRLYPKEALFAQSVVDHEGVLMLKESVRENTLSEALDSLSQHLPANIIHTQNANAKTPDPSSAGAATVP